MPHTSSVDGSVDSRQNLRQKLRQFHLESGVRVRGQTDAGPGPALRAWRIAAGLTQEQLAERSGMSVRAIGDLERGKVSRPHRETVRLLAEVLGVDEKRCRELLRGTAPGPELPAQLPADIPDFVGRANDLRAVTSVLADGTSCARVIVVTGPPGVGKTTLAVHAAHRSHDDFPDGTLFADLRGAGTTPRDPGDVLTSLLRSLGVPGQTIPADLADRSALYRSMLADRAVLLVLDNAAGSGQVRPLLPGGGPSAVLVTSRAQMTGLAGATRVALPPMSEPEAAALFTAAAGPGRVTGDTGAVADVVGSCGRLPLAVRIAGAKLASRPAWSVRHLADRLADRHHRLDELQADDLNVRASLMLSYRGLPPAAARAFRLLALLDYPAPTLRIAAALLNLPAGSAERLLDRLVDAHLVTNPTPDRYGLHDLLRSFAREQAFREDSAELRRLALSRAVRASLADLAGQVPHPRPDSTSVPADRDGHAVSYAELDNLIAAIMLVTSAPDQDATLAAEILELLQRPLILSGCWDDLDRCAAAVSRVAEDRAQATAHRVQARVAIHRGDRDTAHRLLSGTLRQARATCDPHAEMSSLIMLGTLYGRSGDHKAAAATLEQAITAGQAVNAPVQLVLAHNYAGEQYLQLDQPDTALRHLQTGFGLARDHHDEDLTAMALYLLGAAQSRLGDHDAALAHHRQALELARSRGSAHSEAIAYLHLGRSLKAAGRSAEARTALDVAAEGFLAHGDHHRTAQARTLAESLT